MYFRNWPYGIVPEEHPGVWADRHSLFERTTELFKNFADRKTSFVQPLWGYLGAGKTHTLWHFRFLFEGERKLRFIYSKFPTQARNFYELYRDGFIPSFDFELFVKRCSNLWSELAADKGEEGAFFWILDKIAHKSYDFAQVIYNLAKLWSISPTEALRHLSFSISRMWLQGARLGMRDMRYINVTKDIRNDQDAILSLGGIVRLLCYRGVSEEVADILPIVWMLDDSHALFNKSTKEQEFIQRGLRRAIDECPMNLLILMSFATSDPEKIRIGLIDELKTVCAPSILEVPPLTRNEAFEFVADLINYKEFKKPVLDKFYPYTKESIVNAIDKMIDKGIDLLPRCIKICFGHFTSDAQRDAIERIDTQFVNRFFAKSCSPPCPLFPE